jgi:hypothetical protein
LSDIIGLRIEIRAAGAGGGRDRAAIFPSLMLCNTRGDDTPCRRGWAEPTTVDDYLRGALS